MTDDDVHAELRRRHPITAPALARALEQPRKAMREQLEYLASIGRAERVGVRTVDPWAGEYVYEARPL